MSEKIRLDCKIGFQNTFYTKSVNVTIDSIGPSIILRSILVLVTNNSEQSPLKKSAEGRRMTVDIIS